MSRGSRTRPKSAHLGERTRRPWRALALGSILLVLSSYWGLHAFLVNRTFVFGQIALQPGPIFILFVLVVLNGAMLRWLPRYALTRAELLVIYAMVVMSACASGLGMLAYLVPQVVALRYHSLSVERWAVLWEHVPKALSVTDPAVAIEFYTGNSSLYQMRILKAWAMPVALWSMFLLALMAVLLAISVIFRRRWTEEERLVFPLTYVPLQLTRGAGGPPLWSSRALWAGFAIIAVAQSLNGLKYYYPALPAFRFNSRPIDHLLVAWPWTGISRLSISFYPFSIGIAFLLALDASFSIWFFHLLARAQEVVSCAAGWRDPSSPASLFPYIDQQGIGGFIALGIFLVWNARHYLRRTAGEAWRNVSRPSEIMSYRSAFLALIAGLAFVFTFMGAIGLSAWLCAALLAMYLLFCLVLARVLAEVGGGFVFTPDIQMSHTLINFFGASSIGPKQFVALSQVHFLDLEFRDNPLPQDFQQLRISRAAGVPPRHMLLALAIGSVVAILAGWWAHLAIYYKYGAASKVHPWYQEIGRRAYVFLDYRLDATGAPSPSYTAAVGFGAAFTAALAAMRSRFAWWPFHPIGYVLSGTPTTWLSWMPFLIGWLIKLVTLRYGGLRLYRRMVPFFVGVILGDFVVPGAWGVYGSLSGQPTYDFFEE